MNKFAIWWLGHKEDVGNWFWLSICIVSISAVVVMCNRQKTVKGHIKTIRSANGIDTLYEGDSAYRIKFTIDTAWHEDPRYNE